MRFSPSEIFPLARAKGFNEQVVTLALSLFGRLRGV